MNLNKIDRKISLSEDTWVFHQSSGLTFNMFFLIGTILLETIPKFGKKPHRQFINSSFMQAPAKHTNLTEVENKRKITAHRQEERLFEILRC